MSNTHEALELAEKLSPDLTTVLRIDAENAGEMLIKQHALIVQMAEALAVALPDLSGSYLLEARAAFAPTFTTCRISLIRTSTVNTGGGTNERICSPNAPSIWGAASLLLVGRHFPSWDQFQDVLGPC